MHSPNRKDQIFARIAEIDAKFVAATVWGSWMASASAERESLVNTLRGEFDTVVPHKYQLKAAL